jgi:Na+-driven multidrug efflux pump
MNIVALAYMVGIGLETASCTLVGQNIGKGDVKKAKKYYYTF